MNVHELIRDTLNSLLESFKGGIDGVVLFGSLARGEGGPRSDVDALIFTRDRETDRIKRDLRGYLALKPVRAKYKMDTTVITLNLEDVHDVTPFMINVAHDGLILFDPDGKVRRLFSDIRRAVRSAGLVRYKVGDAYGWRPKKSLKSGETLTIELKKHGSSWGS